jgi:hypothetical protein
MFGYRSSDVDSPHHMLFVGLIKCLEDADKALANEKSADISAE